MTRTAGDVHCVSWYLSLPTMAPHADTLHCWNLLLHAGLWWTYCVCLTRASLPTLISPLLMCSGLVSHSPVLLLHSGTPTLYTTVAPFCSTADLLLLSTTVLFDTLVLLFPLVYSSTLLLYCSLYCFNGELFCFNVAPSYRTSLSCYLTLLFCRVTLSLLFGPSFFDNWTL